MAYNNRNRSLLSLVHHTDRDLHYLLDLARDLKRAKYSGLGRNSLAGKNIALIFEKTSTRTRCAFEVAAHDEGAHVTYIDPTSSQIGHKESMKDTARVLGRMYDAIEYRGAGQEIVEELAEYAGVPVFNGLTDEFHPTQMLADVLTMTEHSPKPLHDIAYAFVGDGRNNMANSLLLVGSKLGMDVRIAAPRMLLAHGFLKAIFEAFDRHRIPVDVVSTSEVSVSLTVDSNESIPALAADLAKLADVKYEGRKAIVCLVGESLREIPGIAGHVFGELSDVKIRMISQGASEINLTFVIDEELVPSVIQRLHKRFFAELDPEIFA